MSTGVPPPPTHPSIFFIALISDDGRKRPSSPATSPDASNICCTPTELAKIIKLQRPLVLSLLGAYVLVFIKSQPLFHRHGGGCCPIKSRPYTAQ